MDYEKKFIDFLDNMQDLLDNAKKQGHVIIRVEDLENAFPELQENEDERIRKEIFHFILDNTLSTDMRQHKWLAWLEKQGKPKWTEEDDQILDKIVNSLMGAENVDCTDYNVMYNWLISIKQKMR